MIIDLTYHDDKSVKEDKELQSFAHDIHTNGFPTYGSYLNGHDFPPSTSTKAELVEICTLIMFTGSAQHAAVNFGAIHLLQLRSKCSTHSSSSFTNGIRKTHFKQLMDALPNEEGTQNIITVISVLSKYSPDEVSSCYICVFLTFYIQFFYSQIFVGTYPAELFAENEAKAAAEHLRKTLEKITVETEKRNKALEVPCSLKISQLLSN